MDTTSRPMIEAKQLTKRYGGVTAGRELAETAVSHLTFACQPGEIVGLLGPNGAGKTTTMRLLTGYLPPSSGAAFIAGHHTVNASLQARQHLGYLPETVPLYPEMSVAGYLHFIGKVRRLDDVWDRVDQVLEAVGLLDRAESFIGKLSKGMRQRVGLAQALLHNPDVLILDEPTIGLDPAQIVEIRQLIASVGRQRTVLLSTHILAEVEQVCSRVILLMNGRIQADLPLSQIKQGGNQLTIQLANPSAQTHEILQGIAGVTAVYPDTPNQFLLSFDGRDETRQLVAETAVSQNWGLLELKTNPHSLETLFLEKLKEAQTPTLSLVGGGPGRGPNA
ncbi:MAG: ATP-binding cassette domain-containing protein [Candidatus Promineifilaceae bacterium]|nr:ATP-binding cassette domain-containing protein [Anaerolineaceae bacterium]